ncbi:LysE family translocator [Streptomyces sp. NPDC088923]|uniref:LysE family translocator n=1 Tax=Streptomyces sp. NPDC088923 TaxID=3365913 RepID=UPI003819E083
MSTPAALAGFALAVLPFVVTPGASLALVTRNPGRVVPVVLGTVSGLYAHAALVTAGLATLLTAHPGPLLALRLAGAGYLAFLGVRLWRVGEGGARDRRGSVRAGWRLGLGALIANVLNPKALSLYLVLLPRFVDPHGRVSARVLALTTLHAALLTAWLLGWAGLARRGSRRAAGRGTRRGLAVVLVGAGVWSVVA